MSLRNLNPGDPVRLGRYTLQGRLGAGGMGVVYLGFAQDGEPVAIKTLPPVVGPDLRGRLRREAELLSTVHDPRVCQLIGADPVADPPWLALQYIPGPSLADAAPPLAAGALRQLVDGLAAALATLHDAGLTHRDVKPGNVILTFDGPVLVDFGIASSADATSLTAHGTVVGTPAWMAPEQLAGAPAGPPADVWGWATVAYFACTGRPPFGDGPVSALAYRIQHTDPDLTRLPGWLRDQVGAALSKDPSRRPTARGLLDGVSGPTIAVPSTRPDISTTVDAGAAAPVGATLAATRLVPIHRRRRTMVAAGAAALALVAAAAAAVLLRHHPSRVPAAMRSTRPATSPDTNLNRSTGTSTAAHAGNAHNSSTPTASSATATTPASTPPTRVVSVYPTGADGVLKPGYIATQTYSGGNCTSASLIAAPYAYRCFGGPSAVYDPCFPVAATGPAVACLGAPWSHTVVELALVSPLPSLDGTSAATDPWGLQLSSGPRCFLLSGATDTYHNQRVGYGCSGNLYVLQPLTHRGPVWSANLVRLDTATGRISSAGTVGIATAWYATP